MSSTINHINTTLPGVITESYVDEKSRQEVICAPASRLRDIVKILKDELKFDTLIDVVAIDWLGKKEKRFEMDYLFLKLSPCTRVHLKVALECNDKPQVDSIIDLYPAADWAEREAFDMMGIQIVGHPNLKRLLMWEEFEGHPLRKDYPINKRQPIPTVEKLL